jgi:hypothetical protein
MIFALLPCMFLFSLVSAQQNTTVPPAQMATETPIYAITTQDMPTGMDAQLSAPSATPAPVPTFGTAPFGSSTGGMGGMTGMSGGMAGMSGMDMSASCPMMGQMSSGTAGMSGMGGMTGMSGMTGMTGMGGMSMSTTGMAGTSTMSGTASLYDADGRFVLWNLNPWWVLGWVLLALVLLAVLASAVLGVVTLVRRTRRSAPIAPDQPS